MNQNILIKAVVKWLTKILNIVHAALLIELNVQVNLGLKLDIKLLT